MAPITDLGSLGGAVNIASSINNRGEVVGTAQSPKDGTVHAFLLDQADRHAGLRRFSRGGRDRARLLPHHQ